MSQFLEDDDEPYDDRMDRYWAVNGIVGMEFRGYHDGATRIVYKRADGSDVTPENAYPYDAQLTPYTKVEGHA